MSRVKICGLSRVEDAAAANRALPDYVGFVFASSRRRIDEMKALTLKETLDSRIKTVGVFVNQAFDFITGLYHSGVIDLAQLHGDEDDDYIEGLKKRCTLPVIKAIGVGNTLPPLPKSADYLLFDTASAQRGGAGKVFDWSLLTAFDESPFFLSGGLNLLNVSDAIRTLSPFCVDVSSGVETNGAKDAEKIYQFTRIAKGTDNRHNAG